MNDPLIAELTRRGYGSIAANVVQLRWQMFQAAKRHDWEVYDRIVTRLNALGADIPRRGTLRK